MNRVRADLEFVAVARVTPINERPEKNNQAIAKPQPDRNEHAEGHDAPKFRKLLPREFTVPNLSSDGETRTWPWCEEAKS